MGNDLAQGIASAALTRSEFGEADSADNYFENYTENIVGETVNIRVGSQQVDGSSLIWGNQTYGIWGSFQWSAGLTTPVERIIESKHWIDYTEDFTGSVYEDSTNTTAIGWGTGSIVFGSETVIQTLNLGSDISLLTTKFNRCYFEPSGSYSYQLVGSFSTNNGSNWVSANPNEWISIPDSYTGSEIIFKGVDLYGSVVLDSINFQIKQDDL